MAAGTSRPRDRSRRTGESSPGDTPHLTDPPHPTDGSRPAPKREPSPGRRSVVALRVPADPRKPVEVVAVSLSAVALSEQIGGGLLDDSCRGEVGGHGYTVYLDENRIAKGLPDNPRAAVLAARLGHVDRDRQAGLRGDVLLVGLDGHFQDVDVPPPVIAAALRSAVLGTGSAGSRGRPHEPACGSAGIGRSSPGPARRRPTTGRNESMGLVRCEDVTLEYGQTRAVDKVSASFTPRQSVAVVGPSGAGKSSLLYCLAGLQPPSQGTVTIAGTDVYALSEEDRSRLRLERLGFVFQRADLIGELTLAENIALPLELQGRSRRTSRRRAAELVGALGLKECADRHPAQVSGGQQQRAAVGRAIAAEPAVVFADEPTGALDSTNRDVVLDLLITQCREVEALLVVVTHDPATATRCERVVTMKDGAIVADTTGEGRARRGNGAPAPGWAGSW